MFVEIGVRVWSALSSCCVIVFAVGYIKELYTFSRKIKCSTNPDFWIWIGYQGIIIPESCILQNLKRVNKSRIVRSYSSSITFKIQNNVPMKSVDTLIANTQANMSVEHPMRKSQYERALEIIAIHKSMSKWYSVEKQKLPYNLVSIQW